MTATELVPHEISVGNLVWGTAHFLTLWLPPAWDLAPGVGRPEVIAGHQRLERRWVAAGDAWYVLHNQSQRWAMELRLSARPASRAMVVAEPALHIAGHPARVERNHRKRGLLRRWDVTFVTVTFNCPETDRRLTLEFSGRCAPEAFEEVLKFVPNFRCHEV